MPVRPITIIPDPILRQKAEKIRVSDLKSGASSFLAGANTKSPAAEVKEVTDDIRRLAQDLTDTLNTASAPEGAGLAANQIGVAKRMCIVRNFFPDPANPRRTISEDFLLINPKIVSESRETEVDWEGCLSVPNAYAEVERYKKVKVTAQNLDGDTIKFRASGFFGRVIQHEIDHLDGILFTDRAIGKVLSEQELDKLFGVQS